MSAATWTPDLWLAGALALAALLALLRLCLRHRRAVAGTRLPAWRLGLLLALQPLAAGLLWLTLSPPRVAVPAATLTVLTAGADAAAAAAEGLVVALPGVDAVPEHAERVPDLGTALRRHPQVRQLQVIGHGLEARDRDAVQGRALAFVPAALPVGLVELHLPDSVVAGGSLRIAGRGHALDGGRALLLDPAGQVQDVRPLDGDGRFALAASLRLPGEAPFALRLEDADGNVRDTVQLPLWVEAASPLRLELRAGAPSPEVKHLRRWAQDAGLRMQAQIATGAGMQFGDAVIPLDATRLAEVDLLIADEHSWAGWTAGQRQAVLDAVEQGMGLLLRMTAPPPAAVRTQWRALGFSLDGSGAAVTLRLPAPSGVARNGQDAGTADADALALPALGRIGVRVDAGDAPALARDADGAPLGWWQARGLGRIGLWLPADSFRLVLTGHADVHGALWADLVQRLARAPTDASLPRPDAGDARVGQRMQWCAAGDAVRVLDPAGNASPLLVDPATGARRCAGYWPTGAGWHRVVDADENTRRFHVRAADDAPLLELAGRQRATQALVGPGTGAAAVDAQRDVPGSPWPWALAWLLAMAASWWLERRRSPAAPRA